jgi:hypothetical protein
MEQPEAYCLFMRRVRRGAIIFKILSLVFTGVAGLALATPGLRPWAAAAFLLGVCCLLGVRHVGGRYISARKVSENPQIVYWAHPTRPFESLSNDAIEECKLLLLHLRHGTQLEINLPPAEMRNFVAWLKERNSSMRWGAYDDLGSTTKSEGS